jgi:hypothetical protein
LTYAAPRKAIEELYDSEADPYQIRNLAALDGCQPTLERLRTVMHDWLLSTLDVGFLTEPQVWERIGMTTTPYALARQSSRYPLARLLDAAGMVGRAAAVPRQIELLRDADDGVGVWAAVGLHAAGMNAAPAQRALRDALEDHSPVVRIEVAAALIELGEGPALPLLAKELQGDQSDVALHAARPSNCWATAQAGLAGDVAVLDVHASGGGRWRPGDVPAVQPGVGAAPLSL